MYIWNPKGSILMPGLSIVYCELYTVMAEGGPMGEGH